MKSELLEERESSDFVSQFLFYVRVKGLRINARSEKRAANTSIRFPLDEIYVQGGHSVPTPGAVPVP